MIFLILPVYNEGPIIGSLVSDLRHVMKGQEYTVIAVNDGSLDQSLGILRKFEGRDFLVENYRINMNIGAVFSAGIARALAESRDEDDIVVIMESDQASSVDFVKELVAAIKQKKSDIVIASRYQKGGRYVRFPWARKIFSYLANRLMSFYFPISGVTDYTIFFRAYRMKILREAVDHFGIFGLIQSKGFVANAELLVKLSLFTGRISELSFVYDYGKKIGKSKINVLRTINEYFVVIAYLKRIFAKFDKWKAMHKGGVA